MSHVIREGDDVLLYLDGRRTYLVRVRADGVLHTHKGFIRLGQLIGLEYGSPVESSMGVEFFALRPNLSDYVYKTARQTQIIYPKDMALIVLFTGIGPGWRVVEAGTGTGALTIVLAYYVRPTGRVYSYEIRREFLERARRNIERAGMLDYVELKHGDITQGIEERGVDAVVLDMASPWLVVPHAYEALRGGGAFASFSPTIDQAVRTVEALRRWSFVDISTIECLVRRIRAEAGKTRPETLMRAHTGYITFARKSVKPPTPSGGNNNCYRL